MSRATSPQGQPTMALTVKGWRQAGPEAPGKLVAYPVSDVTPEMSFLEMLDLLNRDLERQGRAEEAMDAAACIGCGACVASCKNASAMLFVAAKVVHLNILPQGQPERTERSTALVARMQEEGFGHCTNEYECEAVCPKEISADAIAFLNREFARAKIRKTALGALLGE